MEFSKYIRFDCFKLKCHLFRNSISRHFAQLFLTNNYSIFDYA